MSPNISFSGLVGLVVVLALIGGLAGLAFAGTDVFNFPTRAAAARAKDQETELDAQRAKIDLKYYEAIQATRTQAEQDKLRIELEARQRELDQELARQRAQAEQDLALARQTNDALMTGVKWGMLILSMGMAVFLGQLGHSRLVVARAQAVQSDPWRNPAWRIQARRQARANEIIERKVVLARQSTLKPVTGGDGKYPPKHVSIRRQFRPHTPPFKWQRQTPNQV